MTVPVSRTSAWESVAFESLRTLVQAVPFSFQSHVPDPGLALVVGRTAHQAPPWVQTLDCGFSPVFAETGRGVRVVQVRSAKGAVGAIPASLATFGAATAAAAGATATSELIKSSAWVAANSRTAARPLRVVERSIDRFSQGRSGNNLGERASRRTDGYSALLGLIGQVPYCTFVPNRCRRAPEGCGFPGSLDPPTSPFAR